jgi:hypothetical protein
MERFIGVVLLMIVTVLVAGFALAHFGIVVIILVALGLFGRQLRRNGV